MRKITGLIVLFWILGPAFFSRSVAEAKRYQGPDDPKAVNAAREAVKMLGPKRGAVAVTCEKLDIIFPQPLSVTGFTSSVGALLRDLGAKKTGQTIRVSLSGDVLFDFDKCNIRKEAESDLFKLVAAIKELDVREVLIEGHTDSRGSDKYNLDLSRRRAHEVKTWLIERGGLSPNMHIITRGYGESRPVAPNTKPDGSDNPEGRAKNRRVEIYITLTGK